MKESSQELFNTIQPQVSISGGTEQHGEGKVGLGDSGAVVGSGALPWGTSGPIPSLPPNLHCLPGSSSHFQLGSTCRLF